MRCNPQDFILSIKCRVVLVRCTSLIALIYSKQNVGEYGLIGSVPSNRCRTSSCGYDSLLLAAEGMSHNDYQKRELFSVNALSKSLKSIRQYLTTRQSDEKTTLTYFFAIAGLPKKRGESLLKH